jgi:hypothetical protein
VEVRRIDSELASLGLASFLDVSIHALAAGVLVDVIAGNARADDQPNEEDDLNPHTTIVSLAS